MKTSPPAGGAALDQVIGASLAASLVTAALLYVGFGHRSGRVEWLGRLSSWAERVSGYPGWLVLPSAIATSSLLVALFGMYWDIALHIGVGRDEGPLANPAHYFILAGLFGIFAAGFLATVLPEGRPSAAAVRLGHDWYAPLGGVLLMACGMFSLIGFPLDDVWHRLFGQDVTLWGPTHLMLIGGAAMSLVAMAVLTVEGLRAAAAAAPAGAAAREKAPFLLVRTVALTGGLMLGLSTFQAEFDFGVPQFQFVFEPVMLMVASGVGLVAARLYAGPGGALGSAAFFVALRGLLALSVGPLLGETTPHFPLYLAEALVVEAVAWRVPSERPLRFALWTGAGLGTVGLAGEWLWSQVWMPLQWPAALFPEAALLGFVAALAAALIGTWIGVRLAVEPRPSYPGLRRGVALGATALAAIVGFALYAPAEDGLSARVALSDAAGARGGREAWVSLTMRPADAAADAEWFDVTAWQGGGLVVEPLERVGPGRYRTADPVPVDGNWKTMVRLHEGSSLLALPLYLPADPAIPAPAVPARSSFTRPFVDETQILQREQTGGSPLLVAGAYSVVIGITLSLLALLALSLHRLAFGPGRRPEPRLRPAPAGKPEPLGGAGG